MFYHFRVSTLTHTLMAFTCIYYLNIITARKKGWVRPMRHSHFIPSTNIEMPGRERDCGKNIANFRTPAEAKNLESVASTISMMLFWKKLFAKLIFID